MQRVLKIIRKIIIYLREVNGKLETRSFAVKRPTDHEMSVKFVENAVRKLEMAEFNFYVEEILEENEIKF